MWNKRACMIRLCWQKITVVYIMLFSPSLALTSLGKCPPVLPGVLNVHLVAHTHLDVGWIETRDSYYHYRVRLILNSVIDQLIRNHSYRFTVSEINYFSQWWSAQTVPLRNAVHKLVCEDRLHFGLGGWVSADEAVGHYSDLIDQLTLGRQFIHRWFRSCGRPRMAWQIDTFGHSRSHADVFYEAGYDGIVFGRADFREKSWMRREQRLESLWDTKSNPKEDSRLFTSFLPISYCNPTKMCPGFDCLVSEKQLYEVFHAMHKQIRVQRNHVSSQQLLLPIGCDFSFEYAQNNFKAIDRLIDYLNSKYPIDEIRVFYSTPDCYLTAINSMWKPAIAFSVKQGDYLPYADVPKRYWVGFYTSRPALKAYLRLASVLKTVIEHVSVYCCSHSDPHALNIHLVPHTHDDVGWTATVSEYYSGLVKSILDSVITELLRNRAYKFTYVEMAFFTQWWREQTPKRQDTIRQLVLDGRLQFDLAGWVSADEATVHYADLINQLTLGRQFIRQTFGLCARPRTAWQVDTFGHSRTHAYVLREAGYEALYFSRMDYLEKHSLREMRQLEFFWMPSVETGGVIDKQSGPGLFTSVLYNNYCYPTSMCFSNDCAYLLAEETDPDGHLIEQFHNYIRKRMRAYRFNHILVPMGCDFSYYDARYTFDHINRLIRLVNGTQINGTRLNVFYSTPYCYARAVNRQCQSGVLLRQRHGDFLPYEDRSGHFWTGFYTSRPSLKQVARQAATIQTIGEQLDVFAPIDSAADLINAVREQVATLQHHDAITGTEQQHVADDYLSNLYDALVPAKIHVTRMMENLTLSGLSGLE
ncbi:unnamed protein product [Echinostoma caproni]|uniref:Alpha-mann_mid domain-containing protein n=1 Tax=Echinostoma caproni TaxID=27848 RepID=A0A183A9F3_9TREM|nr:unnamed protein product [Echinostoma caproni]